MPFSRRAMLLATSLFALVTPTLAQTPPAQPAPPPPPAQAPQPKPGDPFGEEVTLTAQTIVFSKGGDAVFGTLRRYFDNVAAKNGDVLLPYTETRDVEVALNALSERGLNVEVALRSPSIEDVFLKLAGFRITAEGEAK